MTGRGWTIENVGSNLLAVARPNVNDPEPTTDRGVRSLTQRADGFRLFEWGLLARA